QLRHVLPVDLSECRKTLCLIIARIRQPARRIFVRAGNTLISDLGEGACDNQCEQNNNGKQSHFAPPRLERYATRSSISDPCTRPLYGGINLLPNSFSI